MFVEPKVKSSYYINNKGAKTGEPFYKPEIGRALYDFVMETKPKIIFEFGVFHGFSSICIAQALKDLGRGQIYAYDVWEDCPFKHDQDIYKAQHNLRDYGVDDIVELRHGDFHYVIEVLQKNNWYTDIIHVDINNCGNLIPTLLNVDLPRPCNVLFEGGIKERDECWWMNEFAKRPITDFEKDYEIISHNYPGLSKIHLP